MRSSATVRGEAASPIGAALIVCHDGAPDAPEPVSRQILAQPSGRSHHPFACAKRGAAPDRLPRPFHEQGRELQPTSKGLSLVLARLPDLAKAINRALVKAKELGLIDDDEGASK